MASLTAITSSVDPEVVSTRALLLDPRMLEVDLAKPYIVEYFNTLEDKLISSCVNSKSKVKAESSDRGGERGGGVKFELINNSFPVVDIGQHCKRVLGW